VLVQADAEFDAMPAAVRDSGLADEVLGLSDLGDRLQALAGGGERS
jgi:chemotaxis response regulator CheB